MSSVKPMVTTAPGDAAPARDGVGPMCVLVPAFQAAATIGSVVTAALEHVPEVLVVNDGSLDGTGDAAREAGAHVVDHPINLGKGQALRTGMRYAYRRGFMRAITLDADGQHLPADIPALQDAARREPGALVVGVRDMSGPDVPGSSRFGRWFTNLWVRIDSGAVVHDAQSGFRCYPIPEVLALGNRGGRFEFEMEVLVRAAWAGMAIRSVPIQVHYAPADERQSHFRVLNDNVRISALFAWLLVLRGLPPLRRPRPALVGPPGEPTGEFPSLRREGRQNSEKR
jgi:glycosyltransferase involved in cell wall biosynthesis